MLYRIIQEVLYTSTHQYMCIVVTIFCCVQHGRNTRSKLDLHV